MCVSLFIGGESALGLKGDSRGFSSSSDPAQSRVYVHVDVANQTFSATANPTCTTGGRCADPLSTNQIGVTFGKDGGFSVSINAKNSVLPGPAINASFTFSPDGQGDSIPPVTGTRFHPQRHISGGADSQLHCFNARNGLRSTFCHHSRTIGGQNEPDDPGCGREEHDAPRSSGVAPVLRAGMAAGPCHSR